MTDSGFWALRRVPTTNGGIFHHLTALRLLTYSLRQPCPERRVLDGGKTDHLVDEF
jgi:hypothetical protein